MTLLERYCQITKRPGPGNPRFEGLMDELVIYNRDLTAEDSHELIKNFSPEDAATRRPGSQLPGG
jgi:hypothetical protein